MKYLKRFNESLEIFETDPNKIYEILDDILFDGQIKKRSFGRNLQDLMKPFAEINPDGSVDLNDNAIVTLPKDLKRLPIKFGKVKGYFKILESNLTTLEGCPYECVQLEFSGHVRNLVGCPQIVRDLIVKSPELVSLEGSPEAVQNLFGIEDSKLTSLEGGPKVVGGSCWIKSDKLESMRGCPKSVGGELRFLGASNFKSFDGVSKQFQSIIVYTKDKTLKDPRALKNSHFEIIDGNKEPFMELVDLFVPLQIGGFPKMYQPGGGRIITDDGSMYSVLSRFEKIECVKLFMDSLDYNYLRGEVGNPYINLFRFREALDELNIEFRDWYAGAKLNLGKEAPMRKTLKNYEFRDESGRVVDFYGNPI